MEALGGKLVEVLGGWLGEGSGSRLVGVLGGRIAEACGSLRKLLPACASLHQLSEAFGGMVGRLGLFMLC